MNGKIENDPSVLICVKVRERFAFISILSYSSFYCDFKSNERKGQEAILSFRS